MARSSEEYISELLNTYPNSRCENAQSSTIVTLPYLLDAEYENVRLVDSFHLELAIPDNYPYALPSVREKSGAISSSYEHIYTDGTFCLGITGQLLLEQLQNPSLCSFLRNTVTSYLYSYLFHTKYHRYPYGDRTHGLEGILEYYCDLFNTNDSDESVKLLRAVCSDSYRGHAQCPCGSNLPARKCHGAQIITLKSMRADAAFRCDLDAIQSYCTDSVAALKLRTRSMERVRAEVMHLIDS